MSTPVFPPLDGSITVLPGFADFHAKHNPQREWVRLAHEGAAPPTTLSFADFADATHRVARFFRPDGQSAGGEIVAVLIHCDTVLYLATLMGLVRAGYVPFPMSPKNSVPAIVNMLEKTSCHRIITQPPFAPILSAVESTLKQKQFTLTTEQLPALPQIFPQFGDGSLAREFKPFPAPEKPHNMDDVVLYLHSSGSTGFPKPIAQKQRTVLEWCCSSVLVDARNHGVIWGSQALPTFHTMGMYMQLYAPLVSGYPVGLYAPKAPAPPVVPTPVNVIEACKSSGCTGIPIVPAIIEAWAQSPETVEYLKTLQILAFAGGPLSDQNGGKLAAAGVNLFSVYGGTEYGVYTGIFDTVPEDAPDAAVRKTRADWAWLTLPEDRVRLRWDPQGDGTYELQFLTCETHSPAVENLPDTRGYATHDLFIPHPTKKGLWKVAGRKDDVLVLSTSEKVVPIPQEGIITAHPAVAGALMFGRGRAQCGLLVEPRPEHAVDPSDTAAVVAFRNKIWPAVEEANRIAPTFARVFKEMIIVTHPEKPLPRAAKGTVVRPQTIALYADEIEALYREVEQSADTQSVAPPKEWNVEAVEAWLGKLAASINGDKPISPSLDVFDQGFDSLHATYLRNRIAATLRTSPDESVKEASAHIAQNFVYDNPTLRALAGAVVALVSNNPSASALQDPVKDIETMLRTYASHLPKPVFTQQWNDNGDAVVLLTGSTGNVGSHALAALLKEARVKKVLTLNRSPPERQAEAFVERGLDVGLLKQGKLVQLVGDVTKDRWGLAEDVFSRVKNEITHIVHNAWRVDFNLSLASFEAHIAGARKLVDIVSSLPHPVRVLYTSSISAAQRWPAERGAVPEEVLAEPAVAVGTGYGASKFVVENILGQAAQNDVHCTSLRVGQVCGSANTGAWGTTEWVPILVKSSVALGFLPHLPGVVSWIPADAVAQAVADFVLTPTALPEVVNVVHPRPVPWDDVIQGVNHALAKELPVVPFGEWLKAVEKVEVEGRAEDLGRVPAVKILSFLRNIAAAQPQTPNSPEGVVEAGGAPLFATAKLQHFSPAVRSLQPIGETHVQAWVKYWREVGFLQETA